MSEDTASDGPAVMPSYAVLQDELIRIAQSAPPGHPARKELLFAASHLSYKISRSGDHFHSPELVEFLERHKFRLIDDVASTLRSLQAAVRAMDEPSPPPAHSMAALHHQIAAMALAAPAAGVARKMLLSAACDTAVWAEIEEAPSVDPATVEIDAVTLRDFYEEHARAMIEAGAFSACHSLHQAVIALEDSAIPF